LDAPARSRELSVDDRSCAIFGVIGRSVHINTLAVVQRLRKQWALSIATPELLARPSSAPSPKGGGDGDATPLFG